MDVRYINPFVKSVSNTLQTMCNMTIKVGKPEMKKGDEPTADVSGVIGFSGDAAGSVALLFTF
ncbi:MAG: chemotaxis protein CheX, partial [Bacteroidetes bacterium]|nr:chemotaxis protein CheX [Bacteroidota bacterium]